LACPYPPPNQVVFFFSPASNLVFLEIVCHIQLSDVRYASGTVVNMEEHSSPRNLPDALPVVEPGKGVDQPAEKFNLAGHQVNGRVCHWNQIARQPPRLFVMDVSKAWRPKTRGQDGQKKRPDHKRQQEKRELKGRSQTGHWATIPFGVDINKPNVHHVIQ
jgi:hypothetical protein